MSKYYTGFILAACFLLLSGGGVAHEYIREHPNTLRQSPCVTRWVAPPYPIFARQSHTQESIKASVIVDSDGVPTSIQVSDGYLFLRRSVEITLSKWRFCPPNEEFGESRVSFDLEFRFELQGDWTDAWVPTHIIYDDSGVMTIRTAPPGIAHVDPEDPL